MTQVAAKAIESDASDWLEEITANITGTMNKHAETIANKYPHDATRVNSFKQAGKELTETMRESLGNLIFQGLLVNADVKAEMQNIRGKMAEKVNDVLIQGLLVEKELEDSEMGKTVIAAKNVVEELNLFLQHPLIELTKSWIGIAILVLASLAIVGLFVFVAGPILKLLWRGCVIIVSAAMNGLWRLMVGIVGILAKGGCCAVFCAQWPFLGIRNFFIARRLVKQDKKRMKVYNVGEAEEMIQVVTRTYSDIKTDELGPYMEATPNHRVYFNARTRNEDLMTMNMLTTPARDSGVVTTIHKEAILATSKLYKTAKLPDFQGQFDVDGTTIGHFSRIKFDNKDCLITAYHVLDYNKAAIVRLKKGDKLVQMDTIRTRIVCASKTEELDFIIMELPASVFSTLSMKVGTWTSRVQAREPISIHQLYDGKSCVSSASIRVSETKPWHINYGASTTSGTSGAPVLDSRNRIVGIHVESDTLLKCNTGVIPPVFRNAKKESPTNEDIAQGQPELYEEPESDEERNFREQDEYLEEQYRVYYATELEKNMRIYETEMSWAEQLERIEDKVSEQMDGRRQAYKTMRLSNTGAYGKHVNRAVKRGVLRKESPWTCSKCFTIHEKRGYTCTSCGFALVKLTKERVSDIERGKTVALQELRKKMPQEMAEKVVAHMDEEAMIARVALVVTDMLEKRLAKDRIYPDLPEEATIRLDRAFAQKLKTEPSAPKWEGGQLHVRGDKLVTQRYVMDQAKSDREGAVVLKSNPIPIANVESKPSRSALRRARKKETQAVPANGQPSECLNSKSPAGAGVPTTSGLKSESSQREASKLDVLAAPSMEVHLRKSQASGSNSVKNTLSTACMHGPQGPLKLKSEASNCSATAILSNSKHQKKEK